LNCTQNPRIQILLLQTNDDGTAAFSRIRGRAKRDPPETLALQSNLDQKTAAQIAVRHSTSRFAVRGHRDVKRISKRVEQMS
jgi:hypothetical protein